jgi:hypothetical protein
MVFTMLLDAFRTSRQEYVEDDESGPSELGLEGAGESCSGVDSSISPSNEAETLSIEKTRSRNAVMLNMHLA